ncbi:CHAT domain-containing protein [Paractinoplanes rishiriensis]|uniref:CHAT domain-containing protein n=1 Tax=Paractinoplanes rishiriensis TaxID=1050105 RepID=A0A919MZ40_9ACTN|nr:CHAT domain-containing protein [Actinoplanes rishiriensis]GIF00735.1 CHAT domain-containing protein [Actinoplanes rishiriensis]
MADPKRFRPVAAALVRRVRRGGPSEALVLAIRALAWAERARLADGEAKRLLDEAVRLARRHGLDQALADVLMSRAAVNQELGRLGAAHRDLDVAADTVAPDRLAELTFQRAVLDQNVGRSAAAAAAYRNLLARRCVPQRIRAIAANNLAIIEVLRGRHTEGMRRLHEAANHAGEVGPALVAMVAETRAWATVQAGRLAEGLRLFEESARAFQAAGLPLGEQYVEYADALIDLRLVPEAAEAARLAAAVFRQNEVPLMGAEAELRVAQLAMLTGDLDEAQRTAAAAVHSFARQGRAAWKARAALVDLEIRTMAHPPSVADLRHARRVCRALEAAGISATTVHAHLLAGRVAASVGRTAVAVSLFRRAADLARGSPILIRLRGRLAAALAARLLGRADEVLAHCRTGLDDLSRHRIALPSAELRALASGHGTELGQLGLEVTMNRGGARQVLAWMERTRAAALLPVEPSDLGHLQDQLDELRAVHAELGGLGQHGGHTGEVLGTLLTRQVAIEGRIRRATWRSSFAADRAHVTAVPARLRDSLGGRVLVEYGMLGDELVAVAVESRRSRVVRLGPVGAVLDQTRALFFALRRLTQPRSESSWHAARLSADLRLDRLRAMLLAPLCLPGDAELVVVPAGDLHSTPWSALHDAPVSLAPSARLWARSLEATTGTARNHSTVLVAGPDLPGATAEIARLRRLYPQAVALTPPASTAGAVLRLLDGADLAHLACHGQLRADNPLFSSLSLSDGPLTLQELETRAVAPHRLVLASCESGADVSYAGDEVLGFVSAVLARGTAGVVASVTAVPDVAAADLMVLLHERLRAGRTLARALFEARQGLDRQNPAAYVNWCTFTAYGAA